MTLTILLLSTALAADEPTPTLESAASLGLPVEVTHGGDCSCLLLSYGDAGELEVPYDKITAVVHVLGDTANKLQLELVDNPALAVAEDSCLALHAMSPVFASLEAPLKVVDASGAAAKLPCLTEEEAEVEEEPKSVELRVSSPKGSADAAVGLRIARALIEGKATELRACWPGTLEDPDPLELKAKISKGGALVGAKVVTASDAAAETCVLGIVEGLEGKDKPAFTTGFEVRITPDQ